MKKYRNKILLGIFFFIFGIILFSFSAVDAIKGYDTYKNRERVEGVVSSVNYNTRTTIITYEVNDVVIQKELSMIDTSMNKDDKIMVYYHKDDPNQIFLKNQLTYVLCYFGLGVLLMLTAIVFVIIVIVGVNSDVKLIKNGKRIEAKIESITVNRTITRCPYKLVLVYNVGKKVYRFKYNSVWFNIKDVVDAYKIKTVPVYVTDDYKKYYIDLKVLETLNE